MGRDPVAGSQVLQCIRKFIKLRDACMDHIQASMQGESQDEFADMDFDYDDPALNAMLGLPDAQNAANEREDDTPDVRKMDAQFIELLKTSISPRLYSTLSDLVAINAGHDSGVPEFPNKKAYIADVVETWASSAAILVQKNQRDWNYYIGTYGKESWQRIADILGRFEIGGIFCATLLGIDSKAYKVNATVHLLVVALPTKLIPKCHTQNNRSTLLEVLFRRMAAPVPSTFDATLLMRLLNADPSFLLLQNLPFQLEELVEEYVFNLDDLMQARTAVFRGEQSSGIEH